MDVYAEKAARAQAYSDTLGLIQNGGRAVNEAESPPLSARIEAMLDDALSALGEANHTLGNLHGRLFGYPPTAPASPMGKDDNSATIPPFEARVVERLIQLLNDTRSTRAQAAELSSRF